MKKFTEIIDRCFHVLSAVCFGLVSFCVLVQVTTRYTPGISAPWTDELTRLFFMYTVMLGAPMAIKYREYAEIDIVTANFKRKDGPYCEYPCKSVHHGIQCSGGKAGVYAF